MLEGECEFGLAEVKFMNSLLRTEGEREFTSAYPFLYYMSWWLCGVHTVHVHAYAVPTCSQSINKSDGKAPGAV